ncbi:hypothetical protein [Marinobacter sp. F3R08]|uniref:hypothetical protein n=1 Tax=Marinobacter sp. F3R08 TaxID=2841559 RepID=UPI001C09CF16|nr:hypothetical protein [Marinobacter sp. F3R08]MBU2952300.1 hypothetical protein [Marinobacter sp. F3R08]
MDSVDLAEIFNRQFEETTKIDQAFVELAIEVCFSVLVRDFDVSIPSSYPVADLDHDSLLSRFSTGKFRLLKDYIENLDDKSARNAIASEALGPPEKSNLLPTRCIVGVEAHKLGRRIVLEAEQFCLDTDDLPITHILATELQSIAAELWHTPIPRFCVIDSKYGELRGSGIFSASHALAQQEFIEPARGLLQGLWQENPRQILTI